MAFVHLHAHTEYSIDGMAKIREMFPYAWHNGMPGLAITDHGTLSGVPEFLSAAEQYPEVKPVVGCEFWITDHYDHTLKDDKHRETFHLILLAKNLTGYHNLVKLCSIANCEGVYHGKPRISHKLFVFTRKWLTHRRRFHGCSPSLRARRAHPARRQPAILRELYRRRVHSTSRLMRTACGICKRTG